MARSSSGFVAGLTAAALAAVGFLAYQASASLPADLAAKPEAPSVSPTLPTAGAPPRKVKDPLTVPANSGTGMRVVYGLGDRRVWLVEKNGRPSRAFSVKPSTVSPRPGTYTVTSRSGSVRGTDGVRVEHVVRFTVAQDVPIGFSAAVDGTLPSPDPTRKTGGIRMKRADGDALWTFATIGSKVVVVP